MSDREEALKALDRLLDVAGQHYYRDSENLAKASNDHETIRAALSEPEWQPISTAPRDGTPVLVYAPYGGGFITQSYWKAMPNNGHMWVVDCGEICPTHWMPLPSPPKGKTP